MNTKHPYQRRGIVLLVVISALAFFSLLVASYVVFSREALKTSSVIASREYRAPNKQDFFDEALMTLIRGTDDPNSPFFGEDLLSDYYGRFDALSARVRARDPLYGTAQHIGGGFVRFPVGWVDDAETPIPRPLSDQRWEDLYTGRLITFRKGPLQNQTFRLIRSQVVADAPNNLYVDVFYIHLDQEIIPSGSLDTAALQALFYRNGDVTRPGYRIHMNGIPRNSPGIGFNGTEVNRTMQSVTGANHVLPNLPIALQPNKLAGIDNFTKAAAIGFGNPLAGDFDEDYDVADFNNWFLSYREPDGTVVPSFHRPEVINYILNEVDLQSADLATYRRVIASISRATFRPLPIAGGQFGTAQPDPIHGEFTGGTNQYALRAPLLLSDGPNSLQRLNQIARALVADPTSPRDQWDVDNSGDGSRDSIWVDLGLPMFTSPEGKILKPLIAPRIEDLSARLNVNAHNNTQLENNVAGLRTELANWAGTRRTFGTAPENVRRVFRGLGYGPAEIGIPATTGGVGTPLTEAMRDELEAVTSSRYVSRYGANVAGRPGADALDVLRTGPRPGIFRASGGYGYSIDPFGRGGVAMGRSGNLVAAVSGTQVAGGANPPFDRINEALNDPYELDPSGELGGDSTYSFDELEPLLRSNSFDINLLPNRLRSQLTLLLEQHPEFARVLTTHSRSDDSPVFPNAQGQSLYQQLLRTLSPPGNPPTLTTEQMSQLLAPEFRLGRKLDINRPFGNGVDDTPASFAAGLGHGIIDEPREIYPGVWLPGVAGAPLTAPFQTPDEYRVDQAAIPNTPRESQTFAVSPGSGQSVPAGFTGVRPNYIFSDSHNDLSTPPPVDDILEFDADGNPLGRQLTGRQLLARHLYVLMTILTQDYEIPSMAETFIPQRTPTSEAATLAKLKARRLAQWAVNVVDYRDPDAIMTRFVFDENPLDGWNPPEEPAPLENVVWGVEAPELIFSESLAFHDVRVRSTPHDPTGGEKDPMGDDRNTDQIRLPQGSLFLELYCPRPQVLDNPEQSTKPGVPRELYNVNANGVAELDLARSAPPRPGANRGAPVWRIAISERHDAEMLTARPDDVPSTNPLNARSDLPDSYSFEPQHPDELEAPPNDDDVLAFDRYIWFRDFQNRNEVNQVIDQNQIWGDGLDPMEPTMDPNAVFFAPAEDLRQNRPINANRGLQPGQYLILAPRELTHLGSREEPLGGYPGAPSRQRFEITGYGNPPPTQGGMLQFDINGQLLTPLLGDASPNHFSNPLTLVIGSFPPDAWANQRDSRVVDAFEDGYIGLNVSEPLANRYYPQPRVQSRLNGANSASSDEYPLYDSYLDYEDTAGTQALNIPVDVEHGRIPLVGDRDAPESAEPRLGTVPEYCSAFLQRLADPTIPYDPVFNPYRTVDWIAIDLTVFSGEEREATVNPTEADYAQRSRQRNGFFNSTQANVLFSYETNDPADEFSKIDAAGEEYFALTPPPIQPGAPTNEGPHLYTSLNFLNTATSEPGIAPAQQDLAGRSNPNFSGFPASIGSTSAPIVGNDRNLPAVPFAVHPWLNRPFASHLELMMVPASSQGRLFEEFSVNTTGGDVPVFPNDSADPSVFYAPFRHLLNFFHSQRSTTGFGSDAADLVHLFEFVHTLPRFKGEVEMVHPSGLNLRGADPAGTANAPSSGNDLWFRSLLRPPFNLKYDNQRLGQVNLNTLSEFQVWAGLMQGHLMPREFTNQSATTQVSFLRFLESRRGYAVDPSGTPSTVLNPGSVNVNYSPQHLDPRFPTRFVGVYRGSAAARFAPRLRDAVSTNIIRRREVNATLLRTNGPVATTDPTDNSAVGNRAQSHWVRSFGESPNAVADPMDLIHHDRERNAFMRYQTLMRMPNLASDNSQVFLIQLTMGFFEYNPSTGSLGREYKEDLGQNERYRATYIIDRGKEVGFLPGQDLNARDVVLFESYSR